MRCIWCGTLGGFANRLQVYLDSYGDAVCECEWCIAYGDYRKAGAKGEGN